MLLKKIKQKTLTVGIVGLGYVGFPLSLVFAESGIKVMGFDVDPEKIQAINKGESYIRHINHGRLEKTKPFFTATTDFEKISQCEAVIVCVPTPVNDYLEPDLSYIESTSRSIAPFLQPNTLVSLESTTWPGTTEEVMQPILEECSHLQVGKNLFLSFSPEREDPGNQNFGTKNIPKLVGGVDERSLELAVALYRLAIDNVVPVSSAKVAECAKIFENIFRSVNIALSNEMKIICDTMGMDVWEVINAAKTKPFGFMPFWPGPGLGGHCIPIDPFYLSWKAKEFGIHTRFIELAGEINRAMPKYVVDKVQDCLNTFGKPLKGSRILLLGLAYKKDIDDYRESPSFELIHLLEKKGAQVDFHDPMIPLIGKTRKFGDLEGRTSVPLSSDYDCFVLATAHSQFSPDEILSYKIPVVDSRNFLPRGDLVFAA